MIDVLKDYLQRYGIRPKRLYTITMLYRIMQDIGMINLKRCSFTQDWIIRKMDKGILVLPPKKMFETWRVTGEDILGIIESFLPGGKGYYIYNEQIPTGDNPSQ